MVSANTHLDNLIPIPDDFICPITQELMKDPVIAADSQTYEREAIEMWLRRNAKSPMSNQRLSHTSLTPNLNLKRMIEGFKEKLPNIQQENQIKRDLEFAIQLREQELAALEAKLRLRNEELLKHIQVDLHSYKLSDAPEIRTRLRSSFSLEHSKEIQNLHDLAQKKLVDKSERELFGIFGGTFISIHGHPSKPTEKEILDKLLLYLQFKLNCNCECFIKKTVFSLEVEEKRKLLTVYEHLEGFFRSLIRLYKVREAPHNSQEVVDFINDFYHEVQSKPMTILPTGFRTFSYYDEAYPNHATLEYYGSPANLDSKYPSQEHSSAMVIRPNNGLGTYELDIIDPVSPYIPISQDENLEKTLIALRLCNIEKKNLTKRFIETLLRFRISEAKDKPYKWGNLYCAIIPKVKGEVLISNYENDFIENLDIGNYVSSLLCVKNLFIYLLRESFGHEWRPLFAKLFLEFEVVLLHEYHSLSTKEHNLVNEMCNKVAFDILEVMHLVDAKKVTDLLMKIGVDTHQMIAAKYQKRSLELKIDDYSQWKEFFPFDTLIMNQQFVKSKITDDVILTAEIVSAQEVCPLLTTDQANIDQTIKKFEQFIEKVKKEYNLNNVIQIHSCVEEFILNYLQNPIVIEDKQNREEAAAILLKLGKLYYSCSFRLSIELFKDSEKCYYDPTIYMKLVVILFTIYKTVDHWVRTDPRYEKIISSYGTPTSLPDMTPSVSLWTVIDGQLSIPEIKWMNCRDRLREYFTEKGKTPSLFNTDYYQFSDEDDHKNGDIKFILKLLETTEEEKYKKFTEMKLDLPEQKKNFFRDMYFEDKYLPPLLITLRNISYLARQGLFGFSREEIARNTKSELGEKKYNLDLDEWTKKNLRWVRIDPGRFNFFVLPKLKEKYASTLFTSEVGTENDVIAKQGEKPDDLTKSQYLGIGAIQTNPHISLHQMYCALKNEDLTLEREEDFLFIKKVLYSLSSRKNGQLSVLESIVRNHRVLWEALLNQLIKDSDSILGKITQINMHCQSLEIVNYLYQTSTKEIRDNITNTFDKVRYGTQNNPQCLQKLVSSKLSDSPKENKQLESCLSAFTILTFETKEIQKLTKADISLILEARKIIENNFNSIDQITLPDKLYIKVMSYIHILNRRMVEIISGDPTILQNIYGQETKDSTAKWQKDDLRGVFVKGPYSVILTRGLLLKGGTPIQRIPAFIYHHQHYVECFKGEHFLSKRSDDYVLHGKKVSTFDCTDADHKRFAKISVLDKGRTNICIQEKFGDDKELQTFIPREYFEKDKFKLPLVLKKNYTHWLLGDQILIKDDQRKLKFVVDYKKTPFQVPWSGVLNAEIRSLEHNKRKLINFSSLSEKLKILFTKFEDAEYILVIKDENNKENFTIYLPRLNLNFDVNQTSKTIRCKEIKEYILSSNQTAATLMGFKNYLVLEQDIKLKDGLPLKQKILVPQHSIEKKPSSDSNYENYVELILSDEKSPGYFSYKVDETIGKLLPETTAGGLYIALIYYQIATLNRDILTGMNGWESASEYLKTYCWQNSNYSEVEIKIILQFFSFDLVKLDDMKDFSEHHLLLAKNFLKEQHRNSLCIWLRLFYLLQSSLQTDYSEERPEHHGPWNRVINYILSNDLPTYFNLYLVLKKRAHARCILSEKEELFLLTNFLRIKEGFSKNTRILRYYGYLTSDASFIKHENLCELYNKIEMQIWSKTQPKGFEFFKILKENLVRQRSIYFGKVEYPQDYIRWFQIKFDIKYLISYYQMALAYEEEIFSFMLSNFLYLDHIWGGPSPLVKTAIKMLAFVSRFRNEFKDLVPPKFLFDEEGKIMSYIPYRFEERDLRFTLEETPYFSGDSQKKLLLKKNFWEKLKAHKLIDENCNIKENDFDYIMEAKKFFIENLEQEMANFGWPNRFKTLPEKIWNDFLARAKNNLVYIFLAEIAKKCDSLQDLLPQDDPKNDYGSINRNLSLTQVKERILSDVKFYKENEIDDSDRFQIKWETHEEIEKNDLNGPQRLFHEKVRDLFNVELNLPDHQDFLFDQQKLPSDSLALTIFSKGYGKFFVEELKRSFDNPAICEIEGILYHFKEEEVTLEEIFKSIGAYLPSKANIFSLLPQSIHNELKAQILEDLTSSESLIKFFKILPLDETWKELIKSFQLIRGEKAKIAKQLNIPIQEIDIEKIKIALLDFDEDTDLYGEVNSSFRIIKKSTIELNETMKNMNTLCEDIVVAYFDWNLNEHNLRSFFKWFATPNNIALKIYERIEGDPIKLVPKPKFSNSVESPTEICLVTTKKAFKKLSIIKRKVFPGLGYLQTPQTKYSLNGKIQDLKEVLLGHLDICNLKTRQIWNELHSKIVIGEQSALKMKTLRHYHTYFNLVSGRLKFPVRKDMLKLIEHPDHLQTINCFIYQENEEISKRIKFYGLWETVAQQIKRALLLVIEYETLSSKRVTSEDNKVEDELLKKVLIEDLARSVLEKRTYDVSKQKLSNFLLFEVENNLLLREAQTSLLQAMRNEDHKSNGVYQLNMGEGKTSVILILLIKLFEDEQMITRINILEPLIGVMQELLRSRFSGLFEKRIYTMPFTRNVEFSKANLQKIKEILQDCKEGNHLLLITPEQRLCFQLKMQEIFLDYLQTKDADDSFDWKSHQIQLNIHEASSHSLSEGQKYMLTKKQESLKEILVKLGYIDQNDKILKYPESTIDFSSQVKKILEESKAGDPFGVDVALKILRGNSKMFRTFLEKRLQIFKEIRNYKYFDILDESDEILRYGKELNYTLGNSKSFEAGSVRWEIIFSLLRLIFCDQQVWKVLKEGHSKKKVIINQDWRPQNGLGGGVAHLQVVDKTFFKEQIIVILGKKICEQILTKANYPAEPTDNIRDCVQGSYIDYILGRFNDAKQESKMTVVLQSIDINLFSSLLVAKAWLTHGLLFHILNYRYRIEYGLIDEKETAVPYKGNNLPSYRSEFSHPDIMIGFTILSYFYNGLTLQQLKKILLKLKEKKRAYGNQTLKRCFETNKSWIKEDSNKMGEIFPEWLSSFDKFDLDIAEKVQRAWRCLSRNMELVELYLSNFTFPEKCKFFLRKLTGNAHDLAGEGFTKGFSGTDDRNDTMPDSIDSQRLPEQQHTNGKMLHILHRSINQSYAAKQINSAESFLSQACDYANDLANRCYILIDCGAVVTEISNFHVAAYFINHLCNKYQGVVYFCDRTNKIKVLQRSGEVVSLSSCHLDNRSLFVYLDEAHTRGTDLELPQNTKGIVTVGGNLTKDKFMQAVMRLRKLDLKQSIITWGSEGISAEIAHVNGLTNMNELTCKHVLIWITCNTILKNEKDLFPVLIEKVKYIIKKRALEYQSRTEGIPLTSLIGELETGVKDELELSYAETPRKSDTVSIAMMRCAFFHKKFWDQLNDEAEKLKGSLPFRETMNADKEEDRKYYKDLIDRMAPKLPDRIEKGGGELDANQENEQEIEEMNIVEVLPVKIEVPRKEHHWDGNLVFLDFIQNSVGKFKKPVYPRLITMNEYLQNVDLPLIRKLKWRENIYGTENFFETIIGESESVAKTYFLRPVNAILMIGKQPTSYVLLSGQEADAISTLDFKSHKEISMIFLKDIDGPTIIPEESKKEYLHGIPDLKKYLVLLKLFNGECKYSDDEEKTILENYLGFIKPEIFDNQKEIYSILQKDQYIVKGFITLKMVNSLLAQRTLDESKYSNPEIQDKMNKILVNSIAEDYQVLYRLPELIKKLVEIRGNLHDYKHSDLQAIINF